MKACGPEEIYDAFTGDVKPWWDHTFSESPARLYNESGAHLDGS